METEAIGGKWGTWEELLLGGAVLRHGTGDWNVVAAELRARTVCPYACTPEACKAKYEDLRQRYVGCTGWYEELRHQRILELRQALEHSQDSIGSLESKLEALKSRKESPSESESWGVVQKPKEEPSAGSFTQELRTCSSPECQPAKETTIQPRSPERNKLSSIGELGGILYESQGAAVQKRRRGKRKRKDSNRDVKEGSIGENNLSESTNPATVSHSKENSCCNSFEVRGSSDANDANRSSTMDGVEALMAVFNSVAENKSASVFRRCLDSQKRGRYKKIIRHHLDMETIRSRVATHCITTHMELYRDLLLLATNAIVFYSFNTREHKSALLLRNLLTNTFRCLLQINSTTDGDRTKPPPGNAGDVKTNSNGSRRRRSHPAKKEVARKKGVRKQSAVPVKGRKRGRTK